MAYLDNSSITVDAVLTKKGRELLSKGEAAFKITKFALSDDEVDYSLWNPIHPSGSEYYGKVIENMPVMEALVDESQAMRYKLLSIDDVVSTATNVNLPFIQVNYIGGSTLNNGSTAYITLNNSGNTVTNFTPHTDYIIGNTLKSSAFDLISDGFGYTFIINASSSDIINNSRGMITSMTQIMAAGNLGATSTSQVFAGDGDFTAVTRKGSALSININPVSMLPLSYAGFIFRLPITIIGNQSGAIFNMIVAFVVPTLTGDDSPV